MKNIKICYCVCGWLLCSLGQAQVRAHTLRLHRGWSLEGEAGLAVSSSGPTVKGPL